MGRSELTPARDVLGDCLVQPCIYDGQPVSAQVPIIPRPPPPSLGCVFTLLAAASVARKRTHTS